MFRPVDDNEDLDMKCFDALPSHIRRVIAEADYSVSSRTMYVAIEFGGERLAMECFYEAQDMARCMFVGAGEDALS